MTEPLKNQLIRLRNGDEKAFHQIYECYVDKLYYFTLKYVKAPAVAEELVQRIFVKLWEIRSKINPELSFDSFIFRITRNLTINYLKRSNFEERFRSQLRPTLSQGITQTENQVILNETSEIIERAISKLPEKRQQIFRLSRLQGLDHGGIADKLGISKNTVKVQVVKATKFVRAYFLQYRDLSA